MTGQRGYSLQHARTSDSHTVITVSGGSVVCMGGTLVLTASGADSYTWSTGAFGPTVAISPAVTGTVSVAGTFTGEVPPSTVVITVSVAALPVVSVAGATSVCRDGTVALSASGALIYAWSTGAAGPATTVQPLFKSVVTVTGTDHLGCSSTASHVIDVSEPAQPVTDFWYKTPLCRNELRALPHVATDFATGGTFFAEINMNDSTGEIILRTVPAGTHVVDYFFPGGTCIAAGAGTFAVVVVESPVLVKSADVRIAPGEKTILTVSGCDTYSWAPSTGLSCDDCEMPEAAPVADMRYCVTAEKDGCAAGDCINVAVTCETGDLSLPNAMSPNGDASNDAFCLRGWDICIQRFSIQIYNRWGELVFETDVPDFCWDGRYKGSIVEEDVYVYKVMGLFSDGRMVERKGNITVIR